VMTLSHDGGHTNRIYPASQRALPTQTIRDDLALVTPPFLIDHVAEYRARAITQPISTIVGGGNHQSLVVPPAWLMSYYNNGAFASVEEPVPTVTTLDRCALITQNETPRAEECGFRMLEPHEIQAAMAFPKEYVVTGTRREKVKQLGNAVTPPVMRLLVERCIQSLG
jgi:DNA (cytosine-5)-methyltransferase 1